MKRIIALLLALTCLFALIACTDPTKKPDNNDNNNSVIPDDQDNEPDTDTNTPEDKDTGIARFAEAVSNTSPARQTITVKLETSIGDLNGTYEVVYAQSGSATVQYSYEKFNTIESGADEEKTTVTGSITRNADGSYSGNLSGEAIAAMEFAMKINLTPVKDDCSIEGDILTIKIAKEKTTTVLGKAFASDVDLVLTIANGSVSTFSLVYTVDAGKVTVNCTYE